MIKVVTLGLALILCCPFGFAGIVCAGPENWPHWQQFQAQAITPEGRVVDRSMPEQVTTSEGQSYALFFALVQRDRALFERLLRWTERELAQGDLSARLPAWKWGSDPEGRPGVLDANSASDADVWLAYVLLEAGRLWNEPRYASLGASLLRRIVRDEVVDLEGLGLALLPGPRGFVHEGYGVLNPSYVPLQLVDRFAQSDPRGPWASLRAVWARVLLQSAPTGVAPDWIAWDLNTRTLLAPRGQSLVGSYDAIRVYLWIGMLDRKAAFEGELRRHFLQVGRFVQPDGVFPERIGVLEARPQGQGPVGFSAALLPLFWDAPEAVRLVRNLDARGFPRDRYYDQVLMLFAEGWLQGRFRFDSRGFLQTGVARCP
ncbi:cellulase OS=Castellaniella defragrans OX=75697 GN=HNR28_001345 PE=3 SV=1 [Castellaniella defragrans]